MTSLSYLLRQASRQHDNNTHSQINCREEFISGEEDDAFDGGFGDDRLEGGSGLFVEEVFSLGRDSFRLIQ